MWAPSGARELTTYSTVSEMLAALHARAVSATELLDMHVARISRLNPELNAIVTSNVDAARDRARAIDARHPRGGPLAGLPVTIKDCIDTFGLPTTGGLPERAKAMAHAHAPPVARLLAADAVVLGKTNVPSRATGWQTNNPLFGRTTNPWDRSKTPGGSSGGGAAAVAAGLTPMDLGGDFVGSIRIPAAYCGIYGHKPSLSIVSGTGHYPIGAVPNRATRMAVLGPLARSAADLDIILTCIAGPETDESPAWTVHLPPDPRTQLSQFKVAVLQVPQWMPVDADICGALGRTATNLQRLGCPVQWVDESHLGGLHRYFRLYMSMMAVMSSAGAAEEDRAEEAERRRSTGDPFDEAWASGLLASAQDYVAMEAEREQYRIQFLEFFHRFDVLLAPVDVVNALAHDDNPPSSIRIRVSGRTVPNDYHGFFPGLANLSGHPATAFPAERTAGGLPVGLQVVGPYLRDRSVIRFCTLLEQEVGGFVPPPLPSD